MSQKASQSNVFQVQRIVLAIGLFLLPVSASAQERTGGAFSQFAGDWSGEGTIKMTAGKERIRCKVHYDVASGGASLAQTLNCASASYKLEIRSTVAAKGTKLAGKWTELTRDTMGNISGTITGTGIQAMIEGIGFTADMTMSIEANRQAITINPTGATDISQVAITLTRI